MNNTLVVFIKLFTIISDEFKNMDFDKYELISDTESVEDDQQQTCSTRYDLTAKGIDLNPITYIICHSLFCISIGKYVSSLMYLNISKWFIKFHL